MPTLAKKATVSRSRPEGHGTGPHVEIGACDDATPSAHVIQYRPLALAWSSESRRFVASREPAAAFSRCLRVASRSRARSASAAESAANLIMLRSLLRDF